MSARNLYGGTYTMFNDLLPALGIRVTFVDSNDPKNFAAAITDKTRALFQQWVDSSSHRKNMVNRSFAFVSTGVIERGGVELRRVLVASLGTFDVELQIGIFGHCGAPLGGQRLGQQVHGGLGGAVGGVAGAAGPFGEGLAETGRPDLPPAALDEAAIASAAVLYLEGYLWDRDGAKEAFRKASDLARAKGAKVAFSLSDSFCVNRWRDEFRQLIEDRVDILFANESEITALYQVKQFEEAVTMVRAHVEVAALTRSEKGAVIVRGHETATVQAERIAKVVDTTTQSFIFELTGTPDKIDSFVALMRELGAGGFFN